MLKTQEYQKDYTEFGDNYQLVLPLNIEGLIPEDESVRLLSHELEDLDYHKLYAAYSAKGRNPAVDPKTMFKLLVYAYSQQIYSSRKIESACRRDINFMWLLAGQKAPDHATIARFRTGYLAEACEDMFYQYVRHLSEIGELSKETVFIDGTKIEACANKYTFVWKKSVGKWEAKMFEQLWKDVNEINKEYVKNFEITEESRTAVIKEIVDFLEEQMREQSIERIYGKGKHKTTIQRHLELFENYLKRQEQYDLHNALFQGRNNYCKTDPDATFMHMKDDHMRNAQLKPGYNVQIGVDSEYIVVTEIFPDRNDAWTLVPMLKEMKRRHGWKYPSVTADSGYESEEAYEYLKENGQEPYIKPQTYEQWKKRSFKDDIGKRENMTYDAESDTYICHEGKPLTAKYVTHSKSKSGYKAEITVYECSDCSSCPHKEACTKREGNKRLNVSKNFIAHREVSYTNILSETGIRYRMNRSIQVEGAFGVLKNDYEFQRFLLRGKNKVKLEILLLCLGYNINKLHAKIQGHRLRSHLFEVKESA